MIQQREYAIEQIRDRSVSLVHRQAIDFWRRETDLPEGQLLERAQQLVVVARSVDDQSIAAVSTAFPYRVPKLDLKCYFFRMFVGKSHRATGLRSTGLAGEVLHASCDVLMKAESHDCSGDVVGVYLQIQNPRLQRFLRRLVEHHRGRSFFYLGTTADGFQERVHYLDRPTDQNRKTG